MNFTNLNDIREHLGSLKRISDSSFFSKVELNNFRLEIYAGTKALCEPRSHFDNVLHYTKIQVAILELLKGQECAVSPGTDERFKSFEWLKYFTYTNTKGQVKTSYMGEMIPINQAISLIRDVYKVSRLKIFF